MVQYKRQGFIWNTTAGLINAAEAVVMLMFVTRYSTLENAGILTLAFAVGNLMMTIGKYGVKNYQVTDQSGNRTFSDYFWLRILTMTAMLFASVGYTAYGRAVIHYSIPKIICILCVVLIYMFESFEDLYWGQFQKEGRLDIGAKIFSYRWISTLSAFIVIIVVTHDFYLAIELSVLISLIIGVIFIWVYSKKFDCKIAHLNLESMKQLVRDCFPLFLVAFLTFYVTNAAKYAIDYYRTEEEQACFGFIFMPVFVIELLNNFLYQPILVDMAKEWKEGRVEAFVRRLLRQMIIIVLLTVGVLLGASLLGIPVLSMLYYTDLSAYKTELLILLLGGGFLAVVGYLGVVLTIVRYQKWMAYVFLGATFLILAGMRWSVKQYGVMGASICYMIVMALISIALAVLVFRIIQKEGNKKNDA